MVMMFVMLHGVKIAGDSLSAVLDLEYNFLEVFSDPSELFNTLDVMLDDVVLLLESVNQLVSLLVSSLTTVALVFLQFLCDLLTQLDQVFVDAVLLNSVVGHFLGVKNLQIKLFKHLGLLVLQGLEFLSQFLDTFGCCVVELNCRFN
jgi:hypothetical protein